jgi:hypothetical protein
MVYWMGCEQKNRKFINPKLEKNPKPRGQRYLYIKTIVPEHPPPETFAIESGNRLHEREEKSMLQPDMVVRESSFQYDWQMINSGPHRMQIIPLHCSLV